MKRTICLFVVLLLLLYGCSQSKQPTYDTNYTFTAKENGNLVTASGVEYAHFADEGFLYYLGDLEFVGDVQGEKSTSYHLGDPYKTGMFAIKGSKSDSVLIRYAPDNEWFSIYRKASLPAFDFSVDNCIRLEFVLGSGYPRDSAHASCGEGMKEHTKIAEFLADVRSQKSPQEAGLYDQIRKPNGALENCYTYGVVYGFFEEEPNLAVIMEITSYNDLAYSISILDKEYVLTVEWLNKLENK